MGPERLPTSQARYEHRHPYSSETLTSGKEIIGRLVDTIGQAKQSIDLQFYTFEADATGRKVLGALQAAKKKNPELKIRLLIDGSNDFRHGSGWVWRSKDAREKRDETYELINQMCEEGIFDAKMTNWFSHNPLLVSNLLHRDHKKLAIFDGKSDDARVLVTSANIAEYHENERKEVGRIYSGLSGPVPLLALDFERTFQKAKEWERVYSVRSLPEYFQKYAFRKGFWRHLLPDAIGSVVRNPQRPGERMVFEPGPRGHDEAVLTDSFWSENISRPFERVFGKKIGAREATNEAFTMLDLAQKGDTVVMFTPYPGIKFLTKHLTNAAKRGVTVHLIIAQNYDKEFVNPKNPKGPIGLLAKAFFANWPARITRNGVMLHEYVGKHQQNNGLLHAKGALWIRQDGSVRTLIGSTNFSKGPLSGMNREIAVVEESDLSDPLIAYAQDLLDNSELITPPSSRRRTKAA